MNRFADWKPPKEKSSWQKFWDDVYDAIHWLLRRCDCCHWRRAIWYLASGPGICCDKCVPRGCSCNREPKNPENWDSANPDDYYEPTDEQGRKYPCCEWMRFTSDFYEVESHPEN